MISQYMWIHTLAIYPILVSEKKEVGNKILQSSYTSWVRYLHNKIFMLPFLKESVIWSSLAEGHYFDLVDEQ